MKSFKDDVELLIFADKYVGENLSRFNREINHCLKLPYAEFSAILYCFSIIDFLSSIYCGQARSGNTTQNAKMYMKQMMHYTEDQCILLQKVFRHKLVHLANPNYVYAHDNKKKITYHFRNNNPKKHLSLESIPSPAYYKPTSKIRQDVTHKFWISIKRFSADIIQSVDGPIGFLSKLKADPRLRKNFDDAIFDIFSPDT